MKTPLLVFDMDDTLYLERDYVLSGFRAVGAWIKTRYQISGFDQLCINAFTEEVRGRIFDQALKGAGIPFDKQMVQQLVEVYRSHAPDIGLAMDAQSFLSRWPHPLGLISDGPLLSQSNKVRALQLERWFECCLLTDKWGREFWKPHTRAFRTIEAHFDVSGPQCIYIGDNPEKDFFACHQLGWRSIRIRRQNGMHSGRESSGSQAADEEISSFDEIFDTLYRLAA